MQIPLKYNYVTKSCKYTEHYNRTSGSGKGAETKKIVKASGNKGKIKEAQKILKEYKIIHRRNRRI